MIFQFSWEIGQLFSIISNRDNRGLGKGIIRYVSSLRADYLRILIENDWNYEIATSINPNIVNSDFVQYNYIHGTMDDRKNRKFQNFI